MSDEHKNLRFEDLNYNSYLRVPELLSLQHRLSTPPHHDEMFFIIIHQAFELWFKQILHETVALRHALQQDDWAKVHKVLRRINSIARLLVHQIELLSTLTPMEFQGFRDALKPASGFQSLQFRKLEYTYGVREAVFAKYFERMPEAHKELTEILNQPSIGDDLLAALQRMGVSISDSLLKRDLTETRPHSTEVEQAFESIYHDETKTSWLPSIFESLLDFDQAIMEWRHRHILMVMRTIGAQRGTGGSSGEGFLRSRMDYRFFPELWSVRSRIGASYGS